MGMMPFADGFRHFGKPPQNDISTAQNTLMSPLTLQQWMRQGEFECNFTEDNPIKHVPCWNESIMLLVHSLSLFMLISEWSSLFSETCYLKNIQYFNATFMNTAWLLLWFILWPIFTSDVQSKIALYDAEYIYFISWICLFPQNI